MQIFGRFSPMPTLVNLQTGGARVGDGRRGSESFKTEGGSFPFLSQADAICVGGLLGFV